MGWVSKVGVIAVLGGIVLFPPFRCPAVPIAPGAYLGEQRIWRPVWDGPGKHSLFELDVTMILVELVVAACIYAGLMAIFQRKDAGTL